MIFLLKYLILYFFVCQQSINSVNGLRCYTCTFVATSSSNRNCVDEPDKADGQKFTNCNKKYCTILRQELMDPPGFVNSFVRGCEDKPTNEVVEDTTFKTFFRSCNSELCNSGDGTKSSGSGISADGDHGINMVVPGLNSSTYHEAHTLALLLPFICVTFTNAFIFK